MFYCKILIHSSQWFMRRRFLKVSELSIAKYFTIQYVSRYRGHDMIRIPIQGSRYDTYPDTGVTIPYVSRYRAHDTICIPIQGSRYNTYPHTELTIRYVSRYRAHDTICILIQGSRYDMYYDTVHTSLSASTFQITRQNKSKNMNILLPSMIADGF